MKKRGPRSESSTPVPTSVNPGLPSDSQPVPFRFRKEVKIKKEPSNVSLTSLAMDSVAGSVEAGQTPPLGIGQVVLVLYRDGSQRTAKIIDRSLSVIDGTSRYYVHYHDFNRRMDEWILPNRILETEGISVDDSHSHGLLNDSIDENPPIKRIKPEVESNVTTIAELGYDEHEGLDEASLLEHEEITKVKNVGNVVLGRYRMECWYFSPFPREYCPGPVDCLYFCEFTLRYFRTKSELVRYQSHSNLPRHPPGNEIYRDAHVSMFELDGAVEKIYCQNLCYFAKLFLDHKVRYPIVLLHCMMCSYVTQTLYWDVDPFLFYVLCTFDERGFHPVGFFSKEK